MSRAFITPSILLHYRLLGLGHIIPVYFYKNQQQTFSQLMSRIAVGLLKHFYQKFLFSKVIRAHARLTSMIVSKFYVENTLDLNAFFGAKHLKPHRSDIKPYS